MPQPIAFVTRISPEEEQVWLAALRQAMPGERIESLSSLTREEREAVEIAIVANPDPADLKQLPSLVWIHGLWAGVERLVSELEDFDVPIVRLVDPQMSHTMAEAVLAWTYYLFRDMPAYARQQRDRLWAQLDYKRADETTVGLLGLGALGTAAAGRLKEGSFRVAGWSRTPKVLEGVESFSGEDGLNALLETSDILVCLVPLTPQTRGLIDAGRLARLKPGASLINFARGPIVVTADLLASLDSGHLAHAVLDVFDQEPLPAESPLWDRPDITILPHISAPTDRRTASAIVAGNIAIYRETGALPPTVDRARGY
ncbi:glyoxylate/hydroxypyruvate reductase A [Xaviernesmea oryzae]|uniref:Glyoxylate/hydroxypyruvate reductase A n=1 Tax=Xaviernesmea oryzae TaxID=464029 RepID=A0A1Q9AYX4_9HYPH|nr:glyoxylate/hydroxypyruvate reductase A [Xaviernesmea oryzae]OLP60903.1 glyoxylate/hydroxypyruvate reductase A [Xaviernesmea oryzae]SEL22243.1 glyoxylate/hydroxypyruvate reductase A [Xaviernesmea oryzae]